MRLRSCLCDRDDCVSVQAAGRGQVNSLLVDHNEGRQDVNDRNSLWVSVRGSGRLKGGLSEDTSAILSPRVAYRELGVEAGDGGGDVAEALGDLLRRTSASTSQRRRNRA